MNRDQARLFLPLMQAFVSGETIQQRFSDDRGRPDVWVDVEDELFWAAGSGAYRIKPKLAHRPWIRQECPLIFVVENKSFPGRYLVATIEEHGEIWVSGNDGRWLVSFGALFDNYNRVLPDKTRTPCGVEVTP